MSNFFDKYRSMNPLSKMGHLVAMVIGCAVTSSDEVANDRSLEMKQAKSTHHLYQNANQNSLY